jgi:hypothetical protein
MGSDNFFCQQWEKLTGGKLTGYEAKLAACKWRVTAIFPDGSPLRFWAESWTTAPDNKQCVVLSNCLADTSERHQGITLVQRMTFHSEIILVNATLLIAHYSYEEVRDG